MHPATSDIVVINAKRLDSSDAVKTTVAVEAPASDGGKQAQLSELVADLYPSAEFRSFANDAATFLDHKVLIVAIYRLVGKGRSAEDADEDDSQQQLFAA